SEVWLRGLGGIGNLAGSGARSSFSDSYGGLLIGYGIGFGHFTVGLGGGYLATGLNFPDGSDARQNSGVGFVYARYAVTRLRIGAMAGYGGGTIDGSRVIPGSGLTAAGNRGGNFGLFATRAAYDLPLGVYTLEPRAAFAYLHAHQGAFSETGASLLDLAYGGLNTDESDGRLSLRLLRGLTLHGWHLTPWIEAGVQQTFSGTSRTAAVSAGTFSATVAGVSPAPTAGTGGVGVRFAATKNLDGFVRYQGLFSANETASAFSAGVRYRF
ncbi:MAG: autotransporter outer membrane beta-barrel domain-containing protein, partial [Acetobacteraceae bacterium]